MNPEEIKVGDKVLVEAEVNDILPDGGISCLTRCRNLKGSISSYAFSSLVSNVRRRTPSPKYDPCRKFRKGDIVEFDTHGRDVSESMKKAGVALGERYTVTEDENNPGYVSFIGADGIEHHAMFFWLKLVKPVEELDPYSVVDAHTHWDVADKDMKTVATYSKGHHPHAKEAAEAECARLNEEYRKEHE